ncbi:hypothetical protein FZI85_14385 [Mycobacterium sp. CBMA293]|uniref:hypothetical protein n=1 Tax=unclassified Mycolicibacterium TaxID=2636767 RepID=UPI0012DD1CF1|nr:MULTISPECIES: hypothetical protein [unclassified Mycolicibacterium]MUL48211.1 hypothetical protein [Mycolicibacterium sp. CBMA 360]MUL57620.1 hypothetical protein [Mycolicibacterium sp. CBMA 335]MUL70660.1 hypothetical protein [Mycolicibacterium sp. CBMA 311]MUL92708.1 hypothetical protein [Mycolicibacterium sp. CBMA 230]MUM08277.1 hypothetical protein [Mycolicibacterium sp. CBMA 213]
MSTVPSQRHPKSRSQPPAERLPLRRVVIALLVTAAGGIGFLSVGPVTAIATACTVATALHRIIA